MIYCVEDDDNIRELVIYTLETTGLKARGFADGSAFTEALAFETPELILLDIMLPGEDGYSILERLKASSETQNIPVIMVTAKEAEYDKVRGLEAGADDYITKPFGMMEFVARVKAVLRRFQPEKSSSSQNSGKIVEYPDLIVNQTNYSVIYKGSTVDMPPKELELLYFLASSPNQVFTREQLLDHIWGYEYIGDTRTVDVHIKRLREKIKGNDFWALTTVWGIGYKFEVKNI